LSSVQVKRTVLGAVPLLTQLARVRARMAAGISAASWDSAVLRSWPGWMPSSLSRQVSRAVLIGRPGWPPGNSQGDGCRAPMVAWPLRFASTVRGERGDWLGQVDGHAAEAEADAVVAGLDLAGGHLADRGRAVGVEQDEQAGEAVLGLEGAVMQEPARGVPAVLVIDQLGGPVPSGGGEVAGGRLTRNSAHPAKGERPAQDLEDPHQAPLLPLARRSASQGHPRTAATRSITRM
jgi:hypothetical protein